MHLDEVLPLLLAGADGLLDAAQLVEDGLSLVQLVVGLTARHLPVDPDTQLKTNKLQHFRQSKSYVVLSSLSFLKTAVSLLCVLLRRLNDQLFKEFA